jgi:sensor domain CHASE-containing protein
VLTVIGLVVALYLGTATVLLGGFKQVEQDYVADQVRLVERTLEAERGELNAHVLGWSAWNGMYDFTAAPDPAFAQAELGVSALSSMDLDFFVVTRPDSEITFDRLLGSLAREAELPEDVRAYLNPGNQMLHHASVHDVHTEITSLSERPVLVASAPIVTSEFEGPIRGSLIMGRFLDAQRLSELREITGLTFSLYPMGKSPPTIIAPLESQLRAAPATTPSCRTASSPRIDEGAMLVSRMARTRRVTARGSYAAPHLRPSCQKSRCSLGSRHRR